MDQPPSAQLQSTQSSTGTTEAENVDGTSEYRSTAELVDSPSEAGLLVMNSGRFVSKAGHRSDSVKINRVEMIPDSESFNISGNERVSPCYSNFYATLTAVRPLPPISTVSEKFGGLASTNAGNGFDVMHNSELEITEFNSNADISDGMTEVVRGENTFYKYHKEAELENTNSCISYEAMEPVSSDQLLNRDANNTYAQSHALPYALSFTHAGLPSALKSEGATVLGDALLPCNNYASNFSVSIGSMAMRTTSQTMMPLKNGLQAVAPDVMQPLATNQQRVLDASLRQQQLHPHVQQNCLLQDDIHQQHQMLIPTATVMRNINTSPIQDQPSSSTDLHEDLRPEVDEINTREIALKISNELKKYSIPQAVFAQRILGRSQGTLSDLLRNPKPWSKLKSGRETFRRMWKWLQESEYQRLSQLRMTGKGRICFSLSL